MTDSVLTDSEWLGLIDGSRDELPSCCAAISNMRDRIVTLIRFGKDDLTGYWARQVLRQWDTDLKGYHEDAELPVLFRLLDAIRAANNGLAFTEDDTDEDDDPDLTTPGT